MPSAKQFTTSGLFLRLPNRAYIKLRANTQRSNSSLWLKLHLHSTIIWNLYLKKQKLYICMNSLKFQIHIFIQRL